MAHSSVIHKLIFNGINADTPFHLRNKIRVFNSAIVVVTAINLFYDILGVFQQYYMAVFITSSSLLTSVISFILVRKGKYNFAFHFTLLWAYFFLSGFTVLFGGVNSSYYFFLFVPVACNILFDNRTVTVFYFVSSALLMILNVYWFTHYEPYYDLREWMSSFSYPNIFFAALLIYMGVRLFKEENSKYSKMIESQNRLLGEKNQEITDSINYAKKIQSALIPSEEEFASYFKSSFVFFQPKDIVCGDFYWITKKDNSIFYATGDCTGHGVPGGFMTMLGISFLDEIVNDKNITEPAEILNTLRERILHALKQTGADGENRDGMDIVLCRLEGDQLTYAAANNSLYILRENALNEYKPDKQPCGFHHRMMPFTQHSVGLHPQDIIYTFTDGFADQFGGPKGKKYKYKQLEELVVSVHAKSLKEQKERLNEAFFKWKGKLEQIDDVCVIGVKI